MFIAVESSTAPFFSRIAKSRRRVRAETPTRLGWPPSYLHSEYSSASGSSGSDRKREREREREIRDNRFSTHVLYESQDGVRRVNRGATRCCLFKGSDGTSKGSTRVTVNAPDVYDYCRFIILAIWRCNPIVHSDFSSYTALLLHLTLEQCEKD